MATDEDGATKRPAGRPSLFTGELAERICDELIDGKSLVEICNAEDMPNRRTVLRWMDADADFAAKCTRARELQADFEHDRMAMLEKDVISGAVDPQAARVVFSSKQWRASKLAPKKYGERVTNEHVGKDGGPIQSVSMTPEQFEEAARKIAGEV